MTSSAKGISNATFAACGACTDCGAALVDALRQHFGERIEILGEAAGMHLALRTSDPLLAKRAQHNKVLIASTRNHYFGKARPNEFIFGFSALSERSIREGIRRLAR